MPCPLPTSRQLERSREVACVSRGYQARGTEMLRPSARSTVRVSSVTLTSSAPGISISTVEVRMPCLQEGETMLLDELLNPADLCAAKPAAPLDPGLTRVSPFPG